MSCAMDELCSIFITLIGQVLVIILLYFDGIKCEK